MTTKEDRQQYAMRMKIELEMHNFGFPLTGTMLNIDSAKDHDSLRQLFEKLDNYVETGLPDSGDIRFPEANRKIQYNFSRKNVKSCYINLLALNKRIK